MVLTMKLFSKEGTHPPPNTLTEQQQNSERMLGGVDIYSLYVVERAVLT